VAEREILFDAVFVRRVNRGQTTQRAPALRNLGLRQVPPAGARTEYLAAGRNLEPFGHGLLCFNPFWASHRLLSLSKKNRKYTER